MLTKRWDQASYAIALLIVGELALGDSGRWVTFGPFSIRQVLAGIFFFVSLPLVWVRRRELVRSLQLRLLALAAVMISCGAFLGFVHHFRRAFVAADVSTLAFLALAPGFIAVFRDSGRLGRALQVIVGASLVLALIHLVIFFAARHDVWANNINLALNGRQLGGLAQVSRQVHRVYLRSGIYLPLGLGLLLVSHRGRASWWSVLGAVGVICALFVSATRGFFVAAAFVLVGALILRAWSHIDWRAVLLAIGGTAAATGLVWAILGQPVLVEALTGRAWTAAPTAARSATPTHTVAASATRNPGSGATPPQSSLPAQSPATAAPRPAPVGPAQPTMSPASKPVPPEVAAAKLRRDSLDREWSTFATHPLWGVGLGYNLDEIRHDGRTEFMYVDYLAKLGLIGTGVLVAAWLWVPLRTGWRMISRRKTPITSAQRRFTWFGLGLASVALVSAVNPFLNNPLGLGLFLLATAASHVVETEWVETGYSSPRRVAK